VEVIRLFKLIDTSRDVDLKSAGEAIWFGKYCV